MEPTAAIAIGIVAATTAVALGVRLVAARRRTRRVVPAPAPAPPEPATGPLLLRPSRIVVVGDPRPSTGLRVADASGSIGPTLDPRRRLLRDASAVLLAVAVLVLAISMLPPAAPTGEVLSVIATPATAGRPSASGAADSAAGRAIPPAAASTARPPGSAAASPAARSAPPAARSAPPSRPPAARTAGASGIPSPGRLALLTPCPGRSGCYLYVVRTGDTLSRIADFFGVPSATILRLNPAIVDPSIVVRGSTIVLPTPTR